MITGITTKSPTADGLFGAAAAPGVASPTEPTDRDSVVAVYQYTTHHGSLTPTALDRVATELGLSAGEVFAAAARLVELRMLRTEEGADGILVPLDPQTAATLLVSPMERAILQQRDRADQLRARIDAIAGGSGAISGPLGVIDRAEGEPEVRGLLRLAAADCQKGAVALWPGVDGIFEACCDALGSGVTLRVLVPHRERADFASRARATELVARGVELRTIRAVSQAAVVFDRVVGVVVAPGDGVLPPTARPVRDETTVHCLVETFDLLWESASPFEPHEPGYAEDVVDDFQRSIALLMSQGLTDEAVARRLGMSVRTCRRHIAALMHSLGSVSRFQAGVRLARRLAVDAAA
ncbi:helix-turn-helix transcriptional regulator [Streptomyces sp. NPDC005151]